MSYILSPFKIIYYAHKGKIFFMMLKLKNKVLSQRSWFHVKDVLFVIPFIACLCEFYIQGKSKDVYFSTQLNFILNHNKTCF